MMSSDLRRIRSKDREAWEKSRGIGIGGSDASAILGISPWMSSVDLWKIKTGEQKQKDLSDNELVQRGHDLEEPLRNLFMSMHKELTLEYHAYDQLYQDGREWLFVTLDGELTEIKTGRKGLLEVKTSSPIGKSGWEKWDGRIPDNYLAQVYHALLATGFEFAYLFAALFGSNENITLRTYYIERQDVEDDLKWLLSEEESFWAHVQNRTMPPMKLVL